MPGNVCPNPGTTGANRQRTRRPRRSPLGPAGPSMFIHQHHLRHLLRPEHYTSEAQYRAELDHLFRPAWHPVATLGDLARPGDFLTFDLLGTPDPPPQLRRRAAGLPERLPAPPQPAHATSRGGTPPALKLPVPRLGVRPPTAGPAGSRTRGRSARGTGRTPACGRSASRRAANSCSSAWRTAGRRCASGSARSGSGGPRGSAARTGTPPTWEKDFPCNWKVVLENSLESYHIPQVHPKTFKEYRPEPSRRARTGAAVHHVQDAPAAGDFAGRPRTGSSAGSGEPVTGEYWHRVLHPHVTGSSLDVFRMMQCVFPTAPSTCRYRCILFTLRGRRRGPLAWLAGPRPAADRDGRGQAGVRRGRGDLPGRAAGPGRQPAPGRHRHPRGADPRLSAVRARPVRRGGRRPRRPNPASGVLRRGFLHLRRGDVI